MTQTRGYYDEFVRTCAEHSTRIGVRHYTGGVYNKYTYSELYGVCEYISQNLQQLQCQKGIIGLLTERNPIIPCVIAAVHKNSPTFMFLDPTKDNSLIIKSVNFEALLHLHYVQQSTALMEKKPDRVICVYDVIIKFYKIGNSSPNMNIASNEYSFIVSTSGSTGEPKHIKVPIQCIQPNIDDLTKMFEITSSDVVYFSTPLTFDPSMVELLLACTNGASLLIAPETTDILFNTTENSVTVWQTTPSKFFRFSNMDISTKILHEQTSLKILALGGEPINHMKQLKELKNKSNRTKIYCLYGVTELSCWACVTEVDVDKIADDREIPLGQCLSETKLEVLYKNKKNSSGKIHLGSQSRKCAILNKDCPRRSSRAGNRVEWVDTGDVGEMRNGTVYFRGRTDEIIKRFGHKVNLQLIERTASLCSKVKACCCLWLPKPHVLILYYTSELVLCEELVEFLKPKMDEKHWPDRIVRINSMPLNNHGKVCKLDLAAAYSVEHSSTSFDYIKSTFIDELRVSLKHNFSYDDIKIKDFYSIGGTSFTAVTLCNKLAIMYPQLSQSMLSCLLSPKITIENFLMSLEQEFLDTDDDNNYLARLNRATKLKRRKSGSSVIEKPKKIQMTQETRVTIKTLWTYDTGKCVDATPTLLKTAKNVYITVGSHSGRIAVLNALDGKVVGILELDSRVEATVFCYLHRTMIGEATGVVGTYDGTIVCFSLDNCTIAWKINIKSMIKSKATSAKGLLYVASYDGNVRCIDFTNGNIKHVISIGDHGISSDLVTAKDEFIMVATLAGVCAGVSAENRTVLWRHQATSPIFASPLLYEDDKLVLFAEVNGVVHCRSVEKGIPIWQYDGAKGNIFSSFSIRCNKPNDCLLVFGCHDCNVYCLNIQDQRVKLKWKCLLSAAIYSTPCYLTQGFVLAASNAGKLSVIDSETATVLLDYELPGETFSSPVTNDERIYIGCRDDKIYSLEYTVESNVKQ